VEHRLLLGLALAAVVIGAIPLFVYPFVRPDSPLNPYQSRGARWAVYLGGLFALVLFIALSRAG